MARNKVAIVGGVTGFMHAPGAYLLFDGRSLHPLQRQGSVSHSGFAPPGAQGHAGLGGAPMIGAGPDLGYPATLRPGVAISPAVRV